MKGNGGDVTIETERRGKIIVTNILSVMLPEIAALMSGDRFDINRNSRAPPPCHRWPMLLLRVSRHRFDCYLKAHEASTSINRTRPMGGHLFSCRGARRA